MFRDGESEELEQENAEGEDDQEQAEHPMAGVVIESREWLGSVFHGVPKCQGVTAGK
jgi:hypothetical protein